MPGIIGRFAEFIIFGSITAARKLKVASNPLGKECGGRDAPLERPVGISSWVSEPYPTNPCLLPRSCSEHYPPYEL